MAQVNLLPEKLLHKQALERRLFGWAVACAVVAGLTVLPLLLYSTARGDRNQKVEQRDSVSAELVGLRKDLVGRAQEIERLNATIARVEALRSKRSWSSLLGVIGSCMPNEVWLTSAYAESTTKKQSQPASSSNEEDDAPKIVHLEGATQLRLSGYAVEHNDLYSFMTRLMESGTFASVELVRSGREPVLAGQAVRFNLICRW